MRADPRVPVLLVHARYRQPGGEEAAFAADAALLRARGHRVAVHQADNRALEALGPARKAAAALWNREAYRAVRRLVRAHRARVVHLHNTFPLLSPAVFRAARHEGAAVVATLHNFRLVCPGGLLFRGGAPCEACVGRAFPWPGVVHGCWRGSPAATALAGATVALHRAAGTWAAVDAFIALSERSRDVFVAGGLPAERVAVRPSFVADDPGVGAHEGGYALFAGRLSEEKGIGTMVDAWARLGSAVPLRVAGDGPLAGMLAGRPGIERLGRVGRAELMGMMRNAAFLVFPSGCRENGPMVVAEAFAAGLPVVASDAGAAGDAVRAHRAGLVVPAGDADALAAAALRMRADAAGRRAASRAARAAYEREYTADRAYERLMDVYARAAARPYGAKVPVTSWPKPRQADGSCAPSRQANGRETPASV